MGRHEEELKWKGNIIIHQILDWIMYLTLITGGVILFIFSPIRLIAIILLIKIL